MLRSCLNVPQQHKAIRIKDPHDAEDALNEYPCRHAKCTTGAQGRDASPMRTFGSTTRPWAPVSEDVRHFSKKGTAPTACSCPLSLIFWGDREVGCSLAIVSPDATRAANGDLFPATTVVCLLKVLSVKTAACALRSGGD